MSEYDDIDGEFEDDFAEELDMFVEAQDTVWADVLSELTAGQKTSHWMWFVFPQLAELGRSHMAQLYGIEDLAEATAYLNHEKLRARLVDACQLVLKHQGQDATQIFGDIDAKKLRSSMTLFAAVPDAPREFQQILDAFYGSQPCPLTKEALTVR
ncbi:calpastatin [Rhodobacteraceae bacterium (ex Bugula neritina AB1)]|nr:calpastatin [Rhodobacteraceae bacterium (ex Bugula neritina AB1)]